MKEIDILRAEIGRLRGFAREVMKAWPDGGIDGGELQELAERFGLLRPEMRSEPCGEECACAVYSDFPLVCYQKANWLMEGI